MANQHVHSYKNNVSIVSDEIESHINKGHTVQTMCEVDGAIVVVYNNAESPKRVYEGPRAYSQFDDRVSEPYS